MVEQGLRVKRNSMSTILCSSDGYSASLRNSNSRGSCFFSVTICLLEADHQIQFCFCIGKSQSTVVNYPLPEVDLLTPVVMWLMKWTSFLVIISLIRTIDASVKKEPRENSQEGRQAHCN